MRFTDFEGNDALGGLEDDGDALEESDRLSDGPYGGPAGGNV